MQKRKQSVPMKSTGSSNRASSSGKKDLADSSFIDARHRVFVGPVGGLSREFVKKGFEEYGQILDVEMGPKGGHCFITFTSAEVVASLIEEKHVSCGGKYVEVSAARIDPSTSLGASLMKTEKALDSIEAGVPGDKHLVITEEKHEKCLSPGQSVEWTITLRNRAAQRRILYDVTCIPKPRELTIYGNIRRGHGSEEPSVDIAPDGKHVVNLKWVPKEPYRYGKMRQVLLFRGRGFTLTHATDFEIVNKADMQLLQAESAFVPVQSLDDGIERTVVPAFPPSRQSKTHMHTAVETEWVYNLDQYEIPSQIQADVDANDRYGKLDPWLIKDNYIRRLHHLLWIEEAQQIKNIRKFDLANAILEPLQEYTDDNRTYYVSDSDPVVRLHIPGLAEKRPSVLMRDIVYAWIPGTTDVEFEGFVVGVEMQHVRVMFCREFHQHISSGSRYHIRFRFNRIPMRILHRAIDTSHISLVWPELPHEAKKKGREDKKRAKEEKAATPLQIKFFDPLVSKNEEQALAVKCITEKEQRPNDGSAPVLLFGAFGTGKTLVLVEAVKQILTHKKDARILICAPANSAADVFIDKLDSFVPEKKMFRLNAFHRPIGSCSQSVLRRSIYDHAKKIFPLPSVTELQAFSVIVSTATNAGALYGIGLPKGHITHIFLDEAAQMMEAEALVPISVANERCVIVMAGDDKQLGPMIQSPSARHHGLGKSIMERIAQLSVYQGQNVNLRLELTSNYRSHPALLSFSSQTWYGDRLRALAPSETVNSLTQWRKLPNPNFPLVFFGVEGEDMREGDSPSFFNIHETSMISDLIEDLVYSMNINPDDIGVITSYYKQTQKIRMALANRRLRAVRVGSVNDMQGKERKAVFISTVRTTNHWKEHDRVYDIGFLSNERRLNTSLTRAQALVVIVGDPYILYHDKHWRQLIEYCHENESYVGPELNQDYLDKREKADAEHSQKLREEAERLAKIYGTNVAGIDETTGEIFVSADSNFGDNHVTDPVSPVKQKEKDKDVPVKNTPQKPNNPTTVNAWAKPLQPATTTTEAPSTASKAIPIVAPSSTAMNSWPTPSQSAVGAKATPTPKSTTASGLGAWGKPLNAAENEPALVIQSAPKPEPAAKPEPKAVSVPPISAAQSSAPAASTNAKGKQPSPKAKQQTAVATQPDAPQTNGPTSSASTNEKQSNTKEKQPSPKAKQPPAAATQTAVSAPKSAKEKPASTKTKAASAPQPAPKQTSEEIKPEPEVHPIPDGEASHTFAAIQKVVPIPQGTASAWVLAGELEAEKEKNAILTAQLEQQQLAFQQVLSMHAPLNKSESKGFVSIFDIMGHPFIFKRNDTACPGMAVFYRGVSLEVHISVFALRPYVRRESNKVFIRLHLNADHLAGSCFYVPPLAPIPSPQDTKKAKSRLLILVPQGFDPDAVDCQISVDQSLLIVVIPLLAAPTTAQPRHATTSPTWSPQLSRNSPTQP